MSNKEQSATQLASACDEWIPPPELRDHWPISNLVSRARAKREALASVVDQSIIPRLLLANRQELSVAPTANALAASHLLAKVGEFSELVVQGSFTDARSFVDTLSREGTPVEAIFQDLLAPTAQRLGELWDEDINDFTDVTRGLGHLQQLVHHLSVAFGDEAARPSHHRRVLLMPVPGEQHTFGVSLLREYFWRDGWRVWSGPALSMTEIVELVRRQWFEVIGLSASQCADPMTLKADIGRIRKASINRKVAILAGGHIFNEDADLYRTIGADATASDGAKAISRVVDLIGLPPKIV